MNHRNRIRVAAAITTILGGIYAAASLLTSLRDFGVGLVIASIGVIVYGCMDFIDARHREDMARYRAEVWHRRDLEALEAQRIHNVYAQPRDGIDR